MGERCRKWTPNFAVFSPVKIGVGLGETSEWKNQASPATKPLYTLHGWPLSGHGRAEFEL